MQTLPNRLLGVLAAVLIHAACNGTNPTPPSPTPTPTPVPPPTGAGVTVSGVVREFADDGSVRPVANLRLHVRNATTFGGAVGGTSLPDVVTDASGRYTIAGVTAYILFFQAAASADHRFLCDWYPVVISAGPRDLPIVHSSWSGQRLPPGMWIIGTSVYGTVTESANGSTQPVAGASVMFENGGQDPPATTSSSGFYMICSVVGTDQTRTITAMKTGYDAHVREIFGGWDTEIKFQLTRK